MHNRRVDALEAATKKRRGGGLRAAGPAALGAFVSAMNLAAEKEAGCAVQVVNESWAKRVEGKPAASPARRAKHFRIQQPKGQE